MLPTSNSKNDVACNGCTFFTDQAWNKYEVKCGNRFMELSAIDESTEIQHVRIGRIQGHDSADHNRIAQDMNRCFDELFMLATDEDVVFDQIKWIQKGYFAYFESKSLPSCESERLVRKARNIPSVSTATESSLPPPVHRMRSRASGATSTFHANKV